MWTVFFLFGWLFVFYGELLPSCLRACVRVCVCVTLCVRLVFDSNLDGVANTRPNHFVGASNRLSMMSMSMMEHEYEYDGV